MPFAQYILQTSSDLVTWTDYGPSFSFKVVGQPYLAFDAIFDKNYFRLIEDDTD